MSIPEIVSALMQKNIFVSQQLVESICGCTDEKELFSAVSALEKNNVPLLLNEAVFKELFPFLQKKDECFSTCIIKSYDEPSKKREVSHFVAYFRARYEQMRNILMNRIELQGAVSIKRALERKSSEKLSVIGMVMEKGETKNGNISLTIEDNTGNIKAIITKEKKDIMDSAKEISLDEVIGVLGACRGDAMFVNGIVFPDTPIMEFKKAPVEAHAAFISDLHIGSRMFLKDDFAKFIKWLNAEVGTDEQKKEALKIKYLFIIGDLVDGIGIYPDQDGELDIKDITEQYNLCADYLAMLRKDLSIIICGGNHDALRLSEPQPVLDKRYASRLYQIPNVIMVSNPGTVNIHKGNGFPGFNVLMYHGYSFDYYIANVESIRANGGYDRGDLVMKYLIQKRHLSPTHGSTLHIPDERKDHLVIDKVPDFFATGHIHKSSVSNYKSTTMISGSCWQSKTTFQEKVGHNPEPGRVPVVNLKTREVKIIKFVS